ncbi:MAG: DUF4834 family protein [Bacteroidetes bacterium]|nr:DUF4834 family protein [Bacteroidota bacterium]
MADFFFILLIIFIVFGVFRSYIFFFIMSAISKKLFKEMNKMQQRQTGFNSQQQTKVNADAESPKKKSFRDSQGEYVDYEEVKD